MMKHLKFVFAIILMASFCSVKSLADSVTTSDFDFLSSSRLKNPMVQFLNDYSELNDEQRSLIAGSLTQHIFKLEPQIYEKTLQSLKDNFSKRPASVEYLARYIHTSWLAKYGAGYINRLTQADIERAGAASMLGLVLTASTSWKKPGQWARYARFARDLFLPVTVAGVALNINPAQAQSDLYVPPMRYFDFPVPVEQTEELMQQAYQQMVVDLSSLGAATGLTRLLMTSQGVASFATQGASTVGRIYKPLLLVALLSYGIAEATGHIVNETRFASLQNDWEQKRNAMEVSLLNYPNSSYAQVESFHQASRRLTFFMFYPVLKMQIDAQADRDHSHQNSLAHLDQRETLLHMAAKVLQAKIDGAPLDQDPLELLTAQDLERVNTTQLLSALDQLQMEAQAEVIRSGVRAFEDAYSIALRQKMKHQIEELMSYVPQAQAITQHQMAKDEERIYQSLKQNLENHLYSQKNWSCQNDFENYEHLNSQNNLEATKQKAALNQKWQSEWERRDLCRHSPLFLTQTYEYLKTLPHASAGEAAQQTSELLFAQKILVQSILEN